MKLNTNMKVIVTKKEAKIIADFFYPLAENPKINNMDIIDIMDNISYIQTVGVNTFFMRTEDNEAIEIVIEESEE